MAYANRHWLGPVIAGLIGGLLGGATAAVITYVGYRVRNGPSTELSTLALIWALSYPMRFVAIGVTLGVLQALVAERSLKLRLAVLFGPGLLATMIASNVAGGWGNRLALDGIQSSWQALLTESRFLVNEGFLARLAGAVALLPYAGVALMRSSPDPGHRAGGNLLTTALGFAGLVIGWSFLRREPGSGQAMDHWHIRQVLPPLAFVSGLLLGDRIFARMQARAHPNEQT